MNKSIQYISKNISGEVTISGSKSESNRLLILQKIFSNIELKNVSNSDDTKYLQKALNSKEKTVDISHAGTAMRFLTAYFSTKEGRKVVLTGSERMQNRPIKILVEAMQSLGANIQYLDKVGYPPILIKGKKITKNKVQIYGNVSSQYISALLLIAPSLENGLEIELIGKITSVPYIKMTLSLLNELGIETVWNENIILVEPKNIIDKQSITVESDWSSASYFYGLIALSKNGKLTLSSYKNNSLQGDSSLIETYKHFGVKTEFNGDSITLTKQNNKELKPLVLDLISSPDLAQTIAVTCFGLGIACDLTGLHTLKIKETDRLIALQNELRKLGAEIDITNESLHLKASHIIKSNIAIETYNDHRMAMAFASLSLKVPMVINDAEVVTKSYTTFWEDFDAVMQ
ncbi:MAG: 3-phosphoshikimate 1-carboxyvinyltransferase [Flavobacteriaceae bacterium]|nr:3-phosphoshikimate 1-carboxyvinyltransferase [Flavobacteriaceae bacterium]